MDIQPPITFDSHLVQLIEEHVRRLLAVMRFERARVRGVLDTSGNRLRIDITAGEEGHLLIGTHGNHLVALQHLIRCVLRHQSAQLPHITVDVNHYRSRRERSLLRLAEEVARKAQRTGRTVVLQPMNSADRRAIHAALTRHKEVKTESLGEEPNRRVVIRPVFL